jgi:hypothetical protein
MPILPAAGWHWGDFILEDAVDGDFDAGAAADDVAGVPFAERLFAVGGRSLEDPGGGSGRGGELFGEFRGVHRQEFVDAGGRRCDELPRGEVFAVEQVDGFSWRLGADERGEERKDEKQVLDGTGVGHHVFHLLWVAAFFSKKCPRQESNLNLEFRKPLFYPLNYGGIGA